MSAIGATISHLVAGRPWSHHLPWRVHAWNDRLAMQHGYDRVPPPRWTVSSGGAVATLLFAGDLALHRWEPDDSPDTIFAGVRDVFTDADMSVVNLETVLTSHEKPSGQIGRFMRASPGAVACLRYLDIDIACVANNHALDFTSAALEESVATLQQSGIAVCGLDVAAEDTVVHGAIIRDVNGVKVGMIAATDHFGGTRSVDSTAPVWFDTAWVIDAVTTLRATCDIVVVQLHWGYEHVMYPLRWHRDFARQLVERGADIVCCHHAHVVMGVEQHRNGIIAHGLGNFWFGGRGKHHPTTRHGIMLRVAVDKRGVVNADVVPVYNDEHRVMRVDSLCVPGFDLLCDTKRLDRMTEIVERSRVSVEASALVRDIVKRIDDRDASGLRERHQFLDAPRQRWLLDVSMKGDDDELRRYATWLVAVRDASHQDLERGKFASLPALGGIASRMDPRRLAGRWA